MRNVPSSPTSTVRSFRYSSAVQLSVSTGGPYPKSKTNPKPSTNRNRRTHPNTNPNPVPDIASRRSYLLVVPSGKCIWSLNRLYNHFFTTGCIVYTSILPVLQLVVSCKHCCVCVCSGYGGPATRKPVDVYDEAASCSEGTSG